MTQTDALPEATVCGFILNTEGTQIIKREWFQNNFEHRLYKSPSYDTMLNQSLQNLPLQIKNLEYIQLVHGTYSPVADF